MDIQDELVNHPDHYDPTQGTYIRVGNVMFRVPLFYLSKVATVWEDAYHMNLAVTVGDTTNSPPTPTQLVTSHLTHYDGRGPATTQEGMTRDNPIVLSDSPFELASFLDYLFHLNAPYSRDSWIAILRFACKYVVPTAKADALSAINNLTTPLRPAHKLSLARSLDLAEWKEESISALLTAAPDDIAYEDLGHLTYDLLYLVAMWRAKILNTRCQIAFQRGGPLAQRAPTCTNHRRCEAHWDSAYRQVVRFLIRPHNPDTGHAAYNRLANLPIPDTEIHTACREATMNMLQVSGLLWSDTVVRDQGITAIREVVDGRGPTSEQAAALFAAVHAGAPGGVDNTDN